MSAPTQSTSSPTTSTSLTCSCCNAWCQDLLNWNNKCNSGCALAAANLCLGLLYLGGWSILRLAATTALFMMAIGFVASWVAQEDTVKGVNVEIIPRKFVSEAPMYSALI
eukprot:Platyproteum_vivax@DN11848_c0_g1_i1.p1